MLAHRGHRGRRCVVAHDAASRPAPVRTSCPSRCPRVSPEAGARANCGPGRAASVVARAFAATVGPHNGQPPQHRAGHFVHLSALLPLSLIGGARFPRRRSDTCVNGKRLRCSSSHATMACHWRRAEQRADTGQHMHVWQHRPRAMGGRSPSAGERAVGTPRHRTCPRTSRSGRRREAPSNGPPVAVPSRLDGGCCGGRQVTDRRQQERQACHDWLPRLLCLPSLRQSACYHAVP